MISELTQAAEYIKRRVSLQPCAGLILGSGLGFLAELLEDSTVIDYADIPYFPESTAPGHAGKLVIGKLNDKPVLVYQGRFHLYEGHDVSRIAFAVRLLKFLGVPRLLLTNAAGGINTEFKSGDLMIITDHINLTGTNPLIGVNDPELGPRFPDMLHAYSPVLREKIFEAALECGLSMQSGVYAALCGPSFETPAEIRMLRTIGADAVGMSTVPEVITAVHCGIEVAAISCISNLAAGMTENPITQEEVEDTAGMIREGFSSLVREFVKRL